MKSNTQHKPTNDMNAENKDKQKKISDEEQITGRLDNTQNPEFEDEAKGADISKIDRQEGSMNHGETGGNFSEEKKGDPDKSDS